MSSSLVELRNLSIGYSSLSQPLLENINQEIQVGEVVCLVGENGIGKSTLLRTICGLQESMSGDVLIKGKSVKEYKVKELAHHISIVLTEKSFPHGLSVREVLELARGPYTDFWGRLGPDDLDIIKTIVDSFQLHSLLDQKVSQISDGQKQKLMIARALVQDTEIIFLDEPTTYLDLNNQIEILLLLRQVAFKFNKTILMTTHHWELILELSTKLWIIDSKTKRLQENLAEDLILNDEFQYYFNLKSASFDRDQGRIRLNFQKERPIKLVIGDVLREKWCLNALAKWGFYETKDGEEFHFEILHHDNRYIVKKEDQVLGRFTSLIEVINSLRSH